MTLQTLSRRRRRGASIIIAITMIGFVAVALTLVGQLTQLDARRTADERVSAQLRMMLLAGQDWLSANVDSLKPGPNDVPLPDSLSEGSLRAINELSSRADERQFVLVAVLLNREQSQELTIQRGPGGWRVIKAALMPLRRR